MIISFIQSLESFSNCIKQFVSIGIKCSNGIKGWKSRKMFDGRLNLSKKKNGKKSYFRIREKERYRSNVEKNG